MPSRDNGERRSEQMLHPEIAPMQVRAEIAGADPALPVLPLDLFLCLISAQRQS